jgi:hypothetical protein
METRRGCANGAFAVSFLELHAGYLRLRLRLREVWCGVCYARLGRKVSSGWLIRGGWVCARCCSLSWACWKKADGDGDGDGDGGSGGRAKRREGLTRWVGEAVSSEHSGGSKAV